MKSEERSEIALSLTRLGQETSLTKKPTDSLPMLRHPKPIIGDASSSSNTTKSNSHTVQQKDSNESRKTQSGKLSLTYLYSEEAEDFDMDIDLEGKGSNTGGSQHQGNTNRTSKPSHSNKSATRKRKNSKVVEEHTDSERNSDIENRGVLAPGSDEYSDMESEGGAMRRGNRGPTLPPLHEKDEIFISGNERTREDLRGKRGFVLQVLERGWYKVKLQPSGVVIRLQRNSIEPANPSCTTSQCEPVAVVSKLFLPLCDHMLQTEEFVLPSWISIPVAPVKVDEQVINTMDSTTVAETKTAAPNPLPISEEKPSIQQPLQSTTNPGIPVVQPKMEIQGNTASANNPPSPKHFKHFKKGWLESYKHSHADTNNNTCDANNTIVNNITKETDNKVVRRRKRNRIDDIELEDSDNDSNSLHSTPNSGSAQLGSTIPVKTTIDSHTTVTSTRNQNPPSTSKNIVHETKSVNNENNINKRKREEIAPVAQNLTPRKSRRSKKMRVDEDEDHTLESESDASMGVDKAESKTSFVNSLTKQACIMPDVFVKQEIEHVKQAPQDNSQAVNNMDEEIDEKIDIVGDCTPTVVKETSFQPRMDIKRQKEARDLRFEKVAKHGDKTGNLDKEGKSKPKFKIGHSNNDIYKTLRIPKKKPEKLDVETPPTSSNPSTQTDVKPVHTNSGNQKDTTQLSNGSIGAQSNRFGAPNHKIYVNTNPTGNSPFFKANKETIPPPNSSNNAPTARNFANNTSNHQQPPTRFHNTPAVATTNKQHYRTYYANPYHSFNSSATSYPAASHSHKASSVTPLLHNGESHAQS